MIKIEYSASALEDLLNIRNYITDQWGESIAIKSLNEIVSNINKLQSFPALGVGLSKFIDVPTDYRYLYIEKNYVFYRLEQDKVKVIRVLNESQDYIRHLF